MAFSDFLTETALQEAVAETFSTLVPLVPLAGGDATRALSNRVDNIKQLIAVSLCPIGALGVMSTVCKCTDAAVLRNLVGAGEIDIKDAASELGCGCLHGVVPRFSKRGGITFQQKTKNAGIAASAILRSRWNLRSSLGEQGSLGPEDLTKFLDVIHMSTVTGRLRWECEDEASQIDLVARIQTLILQTWDEGKEVWDQNLLTTFQEASDPLVRTASGTIEVHWVGPSMPLEKSPMSVLIFIAAFTTIPTFVIVSASAIRPWQSIWATSLLLGGHFLLSAGHFFAQYAIKNLPERVSVDIQAGGFSDTWMLVDNTWFTGTLARRRILKSPKSKNIQILQDVSMESRIPTWQGLIILLTISSGFLMLYLGARLSHIGIISFEIGHFFLCNLFKGYVLSTANDCHFTYLNNPGYNSVANQAEEPRTCAQTLSLSLHNLRFPGWQRSGPQGIVQAPTSSSDKPPNSLAQDTSTDTLSSSTVPPLRSESSKNDRSLSMDTLAPISELEQAPQYRAYAKLAVRRKDAIGMFYFSTWREWGAAAHIIYETLHEKIAWAPHMRKEPILVLPFEFLDSSCSRPAHTSATLVMAMDETINEDTFWVAGMEFMTIVVGAFTDPDRLVSEYPEASNGQHLGAYVYAVTKLILQACSAQEPSSPWTEADEDVEGPDRIAQVQAQELYPGVATLMRSIEIVRRKYALDSSVPTVPLMRQYAKKALESVLD
ncbi:hypothetical protein DFP72DRAFT_900477 [Ephemerocybe angulata]|uniref:Uncharacterized protein n=1 Tax=Ephemerocybe angulata TaxID=980116 RepID=A0A8H6HWC8_9AGAR|nr:hypothetical protein DFP72DRAFT_900477 [Tulosesus angulatus]